jgi:hypothetical protein
MGPKCNGEGGRTIDKSVPIETFKCLPPPLFPSLQFKDISSHQLAFVVVVFSVLSLSFFLSLFFLSQFDVKEKGTIFLPLLQQQKEKNVGILLFFFFSL